MWIKIIYSWLFGCIALKSVRCSLLLQMQRDMSVCLSVCCVYICWLQLSAAKTDKPIYAVFRCGEVVHVGTLALQAKGISCFGWEVRQKLRVLEYL